MSCDFCWLTEGCCAPFELAFCEALPAGAFGYGGMLGAFVRYPPIAFGFNWYLVDRGCTSPYGVVVYVLLDIHPMPRASLFMSLRTVSFFFALVCVRILQTPLRWFFPYSPVVSGFEG